MTLYRCTMGGALPSGRRWSTRAYFSSPASLATVAADWQAHIGGAWTSGASALQGLFPVGTTLEEALAAQIAVVPFTGPPAVSKLREVATASVTISDPGTSTNPALPDQNSILVSLRTGLPGRENRGRLHLPAPDQTLVVNNVLTSVAAGHVTTAIDGIRTNMAGNGHTMVIATAVQSKAGTPVGNTRTVTHVQTDRVIRATRIRQKREAALFV